jgi:hypothetical protein
MQQLTDEPLLPRHARWEEFLERLCGPEGCDFRGQRWTCQGDHRFTRAILSSMGISEAAAEVSIAYFHDHHGYCDCEVVFNVSG